MKLRTKVITKHAKNCYAVVEYDNGKWRYPWSPWPTSEVIRMDRGGCKRASGGEPWIVFECNDPKCPAKLAVLADDLLKAVSP